MNHRKPSPKMCEKCRYRGWLGVEACCDYITITGRARIRLPERGDGICPGYEEGNRPYIYTRMMLPDSQPVRERVFKFDTRQMRQLWEEGKTDPEIAENLGCHKSTVASWRRSEGLKANSAQYPAHDFAGFRELYDRGMSDKAIAAKMGCMAHVVARWRYKTGLPAIGKGGQEQKYDYVRFRELYDIGFNDAQIARECGCAESTVWRWRTERVYLPPQKLRKENEK